ncbi:hypothetical protein AQZ52_02375 [Novosphingobium fuchskuhlense]|uniref:Uncharacterized protein n=1 Tax=Novosphingobium fuchskuhlense TaxID=1117702 RepID=A0A117UWH1_9SPHN|nr:hypothetical protein [Novosphingobium fuchskuhlense]KUR72161.1 hypothetical protein AQZ52_02375 [Novosphingobium fuchskuhlense]
MRPLSITRFEQLYLGSTAIGMINLIGSWSRLTAAGGPMVMLGLAIGVGLGGLMVLAFWYLIARRASNIAKWVLVVLTVLGLISTVTRGGRFVELGMFYTVLLVLTNLTQIVAIAFLFRRDAAEWLRSRGQVGVIDVTTFN